MCATQKEKNNQILQIINSHVVLKTNQKGIQQAFYLHYIEVIKQRIRL